MRAVDISGRVISQKQSQLYNSKTVYDISNLSIGVYLISLTFENGITNTFKFLKQ